jgi:hypothetical protein
VDARVGEEVSSAVANRACSVVDVVPISASSLSTSSWCLDSSEKAPLL